MTFVSCGCTTISFNEKKNDIATKMGWNCGKKSVRNKNDFEVMSDRLKNNASLFAIEKKKKIYNGKFLYVMD